MSLEETLSFMWSQVEEIKATITLDAYSKIKVTCPDCKQQVSLAQTYRCFKCGLWICVQCGKEHFSVNSARGRRRKNVKSSN